MDEARINRALARLASEIVEENHGLTDLILVGIRRRGVPLANRIADKLASYARSDVDWPVPAEWAHRAG